MKKTKKKCHVLGTQTKPRLEIEKIIRFSRQKTFKISIDFFCGFRIKVSSKTNFYGLGQFCGSELSQCWACAERGEKRVSDLRAGLRKRNKQKNVILNFEFCQKRSVHSWSEKQKLFGVQKSSRGKFPGNSWTKNNTCLIMENQNVARSIWLSNLKKMRALRNKMKSTKLW
jgi:hypothetical protein